MSRPWPGKYCLPAGSHGACQGSGEDFTPVVWSITAMVVAIAIDSVIPAKTTQDFSQ